MYLLRFWNLIYGDLFYIKIIKVTYTPTDALTDDPLTSDLILQGTHTPVRFHTKLGRWKLQRPKNTPLLNGAGLSLTTNKLLSSIISIITNKSKDWLLPTMYVHVRDMSSSTYVLNGNEVYQKNCQTKWGQHSIIQQYTNTDCIPVRHRIGRGRTKIHSCGNGVIF